MTIKKKYFEKGLKNAVGDKSRSSQLGKGTEKHVVETIALAFTSSTDDSKRLLLPLLAKKLVKNKDLGHKNKESIRIILKNKFQLLLRLVWWIQSTDIEYRSRMYEIRLIYKENYNLKKTRFSILARNQHKCLATKG